MDTDELSGVGIGLITDGGASTFSATSSSDRTSSSMSSARLRRTCCLPSCLATYDVLQENTDLLVKAWNVAEELACCSYARQRSILFNAKYDQHFMFLCGIMNTSFTDQGVRRQAEVACIDAQHRLIHSFQPTALLRMIATPQYLCIGDLHCTDNTSLAELGGCDCGFKRVIEVPIGSQHEHHSPGRGVLNRGFTCLLFRLLGRQTWHSHFKQLLLEAIREVTTAESSQQQDGDVSERHPMATGCAGSLAQHHNSVGRLRLHLVPPVTAEDEWVLQVAVPTTCCCVV